MMVQWTCDRCGATSQQPKAVAEVGHWCKAKRKQWAVMKKVER